MQTGVLAIANGKFIPCLKTDYALHGCSFRKNIKNKRWQTEILLGALSATLFDIGDGESILVLLDLHHYGSFAFF